MTFSISARLSSRDSGDGSRDDMEKVMYYIFFIIYMYFRRILCMITTLLVIGTDYIFSCKSNYHDVDGPCKILKNLTI